MANKFEIPPGLEGILEENDTLFGFVKSSLGEFSPWLEQNNVKFFTEYTDHSLKHVQAVLKTADKLIRVKCRGIIKAGDVATLVLAILLHDCAMHLSEAYYAEESLRELGLKIRRISSNLDEKEEFAKKVEYIPCQASFEVADTDLLKLLIGPLYGERPEIGIRELMQNSIDAVREVREYRKKHPELKNVEFTQQDAEVVVSIDEEDDGWWVTVSDQGIGMTPEANEQR